MHAEDRGREEELSAFVNEVDPAVGEPLVKLVLERDRVVGEEHGVHVLPERDRGITEFPDAVHGLEPAGHADLDDIRPERTDVRDDVHVPGTDVRYPVVVGLDGLVDVGQPAGELPGGDVVAPGPQSAQRTDIVGAFLIQALLLGCQLGLDPTLPRS